MNLDDAKQYLAAIGVSLPDVVLVLLVDRANSVNQCLDEHYEPGVAELIRLYLVSLLAIVSADRQVRSQTAPSGASQSFLFKGYQDRWKSTLAMLRSLDTQGCTNDLIPDSPLEESFAGIWTATGGCMT